MISEMHRQPCMLDRSEQALPIVIVATLKATIRWGADAMAFHYATIGMQAAGLQEKSDRLASIWLSLKPRVWLCPTWCTVVQS